MATEEDPLSLKQIISSYEDAEEEFLRELEQCANTDTSDDFQDDSPMLGTLCSLVTEISQLRKQNRKLRRRLVETSVSTPTSRASRPNSTVVQRMSTFLDASRHSFLPKFMSSSGSSHSINMKKPPSSMSEVRSGAQERMSSPPPKPKTTNLAVSAYSTDLSSENSSLNRRRNTPPLVLPETSDSDVDQVFQEVDLPDYDQIDDNCLSPCYPRRSMWRRQRPSISDNTSPSSVSAGSSVDPSDVMTSSRSSFLDLIGFRRRAKPEIPTGNKKRKRRISGNEFQNGVEKRAGQSATGSNNLLSAPRTTQNSVDSQKHVSRSLKNVANEGGQLNTRSGHLNDKIGSPNKIRPKSIAAYLNPSELNSTKSPRLKFKTKSWRSVASRASEDTNNSQLDVAALDEELQMTQDENIMLRNEIQVLKTRNNQLIENLRDKSMQLSKTQHRIDVQIEEAKKRETMNGALDRLFLRERIGHITETSLNTIESRLKEFETDLQVTKNEALRNQQMVINSTFREQSAYQNCLEQVERLQRENFSLLQAKASEFGIADKQIREKLEMLPRYDSLYAFTIRIVRKIGQLRNTLNEKSTRLMRSELELMHQQSALLIAHTQLERQKLKPQTLGEKSRGLKRPASFHGDDLIDKLTKPHLNVFLPFKLHGARIEQQRKSQANTLLANNNDQMEDDDRIEAEFLRFFDSSRFVHRQNGTATPTPEREKITPRLENVIVYRNGRGTVSPMNSPVLERRRFMSGKQSPLAARKNPQPLIIANNMDEDNECGNRRPNSWIDPQDHRNGSIQQIQQPSNNYYHHRQESNELRRLADDITNHRVAGADNYRLHDFSIQQPNASPIIRYSGRCDHSQNGRMSSLQDISCQQNGLRSPSTTPILTRRVPILGSPKTERRLHKQQSFQISPNGSSYDNQPLYDSPPRAPESSDYGSIESRPANGLSRRPSSDRRPPGQKPFHIHHHHHSRLPQPQAATFNPSNVSNINSNSNGSTGATALKRSNAIFRKNSPILSAEQRPSVLRQNALLAARRTRQSASESPRLMPRFHHQHNTNPTHMASTIAEEKEDEQLSSTNEFIEAPTEFSNFGNSRLPKPNNITPNNSFVERAAKKAGNSWLSRLRLNTKRS